MRDNTSPAATASPEDNWEQLFEAALLERDPVAREQRLCNAKDAIMDRIEDSFDAAAVSEYRLLLAALNAIGEFQRVPKSDDLQGVPPAQPFGHAA